MAGRDLRNAREAVVPRVSDDLAASDQLGSEAIRLPDPRVARRDESGRRVDTRADNRDEQVIHVVHEGSLRGL